MGFDRRAIIRSGWYSVHAPVGWQTRLWMFCSGPHKSADLALRAGRRCDRKGETPEEHSAVFISETRPTWLMEVEDE